MVDRDTTLPVGVYELTGPLVVRGAALTLQAGTHLVFRGAHALLVESGGSLLALGDSLNPVVLEGDTWQGVRFSASEAGSHLSYCEIRGAGLPAALLVYSSGKSTVEHTRIHENLGFGVFLARGARFQTFRFNRLEQNAWYPVLCQDLQALVGMDSTNRFLGDPRSGIWVDGPVTVQAPVHLALGPQTPLHLDGGLTVSDSLVLERMDLRVRGAIQVDEGGWLRLHQVVFHPLQSSWEGIRVIGGAALWHTVSLYQAGTPGEAAVRVYPTCSRFRWVEGEIVEPVGFGLDLGREPDSLWDITVRQAGEVPVILRNPGILSAPLRLHLEENPSPWIKITSGNVPESDTWRPPGAPVVFTGNVLLRSEGTSPTLLYLQPGLELRFYSYAGVLVGFHGPAGLVARGVRFTGRNLDDPRWRSLRFGPETVEGTRLDSCVLEYGGDVRTQPDSGIVVMTDTQVPVLEGNLIRKSHTYGVYLRGTANSPAYRQQILNQNQFEDNALGAIGPEGARP